MDQQHTEPRGVVVPDGSTGSTATATLPPAGTAAYDALMGDRALVEIGRKRPSPIALLFGAAGLLIGVGAGYGIWGTGGGAATTSTGTGFPGGAGGAGTTSRSGSAASGGRTGGAPTGASALGSGTSGEIAAISANSIEVQEDGTETTVKFSGSTSITKTSASTSSALVVGACARAAGTTSSNGTVSATTIVITPAVDGTCTAATGASG